MSSLTTNWAKVATASTVVEGVASAHILLASSREASVAGNKAVGLVAVPTDTSPPVPEEKEAEAELEGDSELDGDSEVDGLSEAELLPLGDNELEGLIEALGERLADGLKEAEELPEGDTELLGLVELLGLREVELEGDKLRLAELEGESEELGEIEVEELGDKLPEGESEADVEPLGEVEAEGETELEGDKEADTAVIAVLTLPKSLTKTAPFTVNNVAVPTAPALVLAVKVIVFKAWIDQSGLVTLAFCLFCWKDMVFVLSFFK